MSSSRYAATVNPPRRAKTQAATTTVLPAILPAPPEFPIPQNVPQFDLSHSSQPPRKKRGRKPATGIGSSSRTAREAVRKANHSRIEKARRGKINDALMELKSLIPPDFASTVQENTDDEDEDEDEDEHEDPSSAFSKNDQGKKTGPAREFKLDILERTVLFVRSLLQRLHAAEASDSNQPIAQVHDGCRCRGSCREDEDGREKKRKIALSTDDERVQKKFKSSIMGDQNRTSDAEQENRFQNDEEDQTTEDEDTRTKLPHSATRSHSSKVRLPSVSELLLSTNNIESYHSQTSQLPSPSVSPNLFPHHYRSHQDSSVAAYLSPCITPYLPPQVSTCRLVETGRVEHRAENLQAEKSPGSRSCPAGMSHLLTPASTCSTHPNAPLPTLDLPTSAMSDYERLDEGEGDDNEDDEIVAAVDAENEDGGARDATLALLQMRGSGHLNKTGGKLTNRSQASTRPTLTPRNLLGL